MTRKAPIAKISAPRLFSVIPRTRLFSRLDKNRGRPLIWLDSPPGAGKTSLVASYLEERDISTLWYQVDAGDTDPAAIFHYLTAAVEHFSRREANALPRLAKEHFADLSGFARTYFRRVFAGLPEGAVIVSTTTRT